MGQWIRAVPQHLSSANRLKQTTQGRPVHNACERFNNIDAKETNEANLLSALRRPRPPATGKSWHLDKVRERICKVGARFTFSGRCVVVAIAGTARAIRRALWAEVEKVSADPRTTSWGKGGRVSAALKRIVFSQKSAQYGDQAADRRPDE